MRQRLAAALLATAAMPAMAGAEITIIPEYDADAVFGGEILTPQDFGARLTVGIYEDPRLASPQRVREIVEALDLQSALGAPIVDILIHPDTGDFVGIDRGSVELVDTLPDGSVIISARDPQGRFTAATRDTLVWSQPNGVPVCFDVLDIDDTDAPMSFTLLIDRSGSMDGVMMDVVDTTNHFLDLLPGNAQCTVVSFAADWTRHTPSPPLHCRDFRLHPDDIAADGATDLYGPLEAAYITYGGFRYDGWQTAVIVISDGADTQAGDDADRTRARLDAAKEDTRTFVFWLGHHTEAYLAGLADYFIGRQGEVAAYLTEVYGAVGEAYRRQQVLRPRACAP